MAQGRAIRPGQEAAVAEMLGRGAELPGGCRFSGGRIEADVVAATYTCPNGEISLELSEARVAPAALPRSDTLALAVRRGSPPPQLLDAVLARIRAAEHTIGWSEQTSGAPPPPAPATAATTALWLAAGLALAVVALWMVRGSRGALRLAARRAGLALLCLVVLALVAELGYRAVLRLGAPPRPAAERFELYGIGESTMVGQPFDPKLSIPRLLEHMFGGEIAGRPIAVHNLAERGAPLYPQALAFERTLAHRTPGAPGAVLIMSGHNEAVVPAAADGAGPYVPNLIADRSALARDLLLALRRRRLVGRERTLAAYEYYLRRVIETAKANGLLPILATMASNIAGIEPNPDDSGSDPAAAVVVAGLELEAQGRHAEALALYRGRFADFPTSAALRYRSGRCAEALGDLDAAREAYWSAVDLDSRRLFGRATRAQNDFVRRLAREYDVPLVDAVQILEARSPRRLLDDALFVDGQHPDLAGYLYLADAFASILSQRFATPVRHPLADEGQVAAALDLQPADLRRARINAGSWLIATSVAHPFAHDRLDLAERRFRAALGSGDDFSAWFGIALAQAGRRGDLLRNPADIELLGELAGYRDAYRVAPHALPALMTRFDQLGVDDDVLAGLTTSAPDSPLTADRQR